MSKKFLAGVFAVAMFAFATVTLAAYDFGTTTVKVGNKGAAVVAVQTVVGANPDGVFGPMTKAKVMAWQSANGLTADGLFGAKSKAVANSTTTTTTTTTTTSGVAGCVAGAAFSSTTGAPCVTVTTNVPGCIAGAAFSSTTGQACGTTTTVVTGPLKGGAGDMKMTSYSASLKSEVKEGQSGAKILGFRVEAIDSDIELNNVKIEVTSADARITKFADSVDIYMGSTKVGSADASDFTKDSNKYSRTITLSGAIVREGNKEPFYVSVNAINDIDDSYDAKSFTVKITDSRFTDGTGLVLSTTENIVSGNIRITAKETSDVSVKVSSANPENGSIKVKENSTSDEVLALAFRLDSDSDSQDVTLIEVPITVTIADGGANAIKGENVIDSVIFKINGKSYTADAPAVTTLTSPGAGSLVYTVDLDGSDVVIESGDVVEAKVYVKFAQQKNNYAAEATKVTVSIEDTLPNSNIKAENSNQDSVKIKGSAQTGAAQNLSLNDVTISAMSWAVSGAETAGVIDFMFTMKSDSTDITLNPASSIVATGSGNVTSIAGVGTPYAALPATITRISSGSGLTVLAGETVSFRASYNVIGTAGQVGDVTITSIAGQTITKQMSPRLFLKK